MNGTWIFLKLALADWTKDLNLGFDLGLDLNLGIEPEENATKREKKR